MKRVLRVVQRMTPISSKGLLPCVTMVVQQIFWSVIGCKSLWQKGVGFEHKKHNKANFCRLSRSELLTLHAGFG